MIVREWFSGGTGAEASALCGAGRAASRVPSRGSRAPAERIGCGGGERGGEDDQSWHLAPEVSGATCMFVWARPAALDDWHRRMARDAVENADANGTHDEQAQRPLACPALVLRALS
jgi:hypothetical protein